MQEAKKETQRIRAYRAVLKGTTNGKFIHDPELRLGSTYRTRISELRIMMDEKFGLGPEGPGSGWLPRKQIEPMADNVFYWKLIIPPGADRRDPLELLNLPAEKKELDAGADVVCNQTEMFKTGGDHGQDEGQDRAHQEGAGNQVSTAE